MSFRENLRSSYQDFRETIPNAYLKTMVKAGLLFSSGSLAELLSERSLERKAFPEPFDVAAHIGNAREGAMVTVAASIVLGGLAVIHNEELIDSRKDRLNIAPKVAAGAFAVSSAVQVIGEKYELSWGIGGNTGDMLDAAYGVGWSGLVAVGAVKLHASIERAVHERGLEVETEGLARIEQLNAQED